MTDYTFFTNLLTEIPEIPQNTIISRTLLKQGGLKTILFAFDTGQELSEHTSSQTAQLYFLKGEATVSLGNDVHQVKAHSWVQMPPHLPHSIVAKTPLIMLLIMQGD